MKYNIKNAYVYQKYFPDKSKEKKFYTPSKFGYEKEINKRLQWWNKLRKNSKKNQDSDSE